MEQALVSTINVSVRRLIIYYIIPGLFLLFNLVVAIGNSEISSKIDWGFLYQLSSDGVKDTLIIVLALMLSIAFGFILENLGSWWELKYCRHHVVEYIRKDVDGINARIKRKAPHLDEYQIYSFAWEEFLVAKYDSDKLTAHRFLRYMLERLKFELVMSFSILFSILTWLMYSVALKFSGEVSVDYLLMSYLILLYLILRFLLITEAKKSSVSLHECRLMIVESQIGEEILSLRLASFSSKERDSKDVDNNVIRRFQSNFEDLFGIIKDFVRVLGFILLFEWVSTGFFWQRACKNLKKLKNGLRTQY